MSIATFAKKIIDSTIASGADWPADAVYMTEMLFEECKDTVAIKQEFFQTKEGLDSYLEGMREEWSRKNLDAQIEVYEWDLGPNHIATHILHQKKVRNDSWKGVALVALAAVTILSIARAGRKNG